MGEEDSPENRDQAKENGDSDQPSGGSAYEVAVDHAVRWWTAEEENSRRLATSSNIILTASTAFVGLGLFRIGVSALTPVTQVVHIHPCLRNAADVMLILGLMVLIIASFWSQVGKLPKTNGSEQSKKKSGTLASSDLAYESSDLEKLLDMPEPTSTDPDYYRLGAFIPIQMAAEKLALRTQRSGGDSTVLG